mmetsp:Transcript_28058/g.68198  ORF Transcript_28058/g.68198 Transcript_28058/m.68198 type:complete len:530 (+) Transcript_28058:1305-2894(+)
MEETRHRLGSTTSSTGGGPRLHSSTVLTSQYFSHGNRGRDWGATTSTTTTTTTTTGGDGGDGSGSNYFDVLQRETRRSSASPSTPTSAVGAASSASSSGPSSRLRKRGHDSTEAAAATATTGDPASTPKRQRRSSRMARLESDSFPSANRSPAQTTSSSTNIRRGRGRGNGGSRSSRSSSSRLKKPPPASSSSSVPSNLKKPPPGSGNRKVASSGIKNGDSDEKEEEKNNTLTQCCICMDDVEKKDLAKISCCTHLFCFGCIEQWSEQENKCPLCKKRFTRIDRVHTVKTTGKRGGGGGKSSANKNTKRVKNRNQQYAPSSATIESLIASLSSRHSVLSRILLSGQPSVGSLSGNPIRSIHRPIRPAGFEGPLPGPRAAAVAGATSTSGGARPRAGQSLHSFLSQEGRAAMSAAMSEDSVEIFSDLEDESDDENPFSAFLRDLSSHRTSIPSRSTTASIGLSMSISGTVQMPTAMQFEPPARQFASNAGEANAGQSLDNPLEIDDSDDDDSDDEIEVVEVRRSTVARDV